MLDQGPPFADIHGGDMDGGQLAEQQERGDLAGVDAVGLAFGSEDQAEASGVGDDDACGQGPECLVEQAVAGGGLEGDLDGGALAGGGLGEVGLEVPGQVLDAALDGELLDGLAPIVENADGVEAVMGVDTN